MSVSGSVFSQVNIITFSEMENLKKNIPCYEISKAPCDDVNSSELFSSITGSEKAQLWRQIAGKLWIHIGENGLRPKQEKEIYTWHQRTVWGPKFAY